MNKEQEFFKFFSSLSTKSFGGDPIKYNVFIRDGETPTRKGKYFTISGGMFSKTCFIGVDENNEDLFEII